MEAGSNKVKLENWDRNYLTVLKALTLISLIYSVSKYDLSIFRRADLQIM